MFQSLFERSADAIYLFDPKQQVYVDCNQTAVSMMRATNKQELLLHPAELSPEFQPDGRSSREKTFEMAEIALRKGSHRFEWVSRRHDGSELPTEIVLTAIPTDDQPLLLAVTHDISNCTESAADRESNTTTFERRVAQRTSALVRANEQLKDAQQESSARASQIQKHRDVLLELAQFNKSNFSEAVQKICAVSASTLGVARASYWSLTDEDSAIVCECLHELATRSSNADAKGARLVMDESPPYFQALAGKRPIVAGHAWEHPATRCLAEGYLKPLGITSMLDVPVWVRGHVVGVLCHEHIGAERNWTAEEIDFAFALAAMVSLAIEESQRAWSENRLRESEARFSAAFQASPVFMTICRVDDGRYVLANEAFLRWSGYRLDEVIGRTSKELCLWGDPAECEPFWQELRRSGSIPEREFRVRNRYGQTFTALASANIIHVNGVPHVLTVGLDITQRKQAESELLKTVAREKELGRLRSNFVSMVSHEFRTPLSIIQSSAEILDDYLERLEAEERTDHLRSIQKNTRRMAALMEEVLLIGSFDGGKVEFKPQPLDLGQFARRLVDEILSSTDRRCPVELVLGDMPAETQADERLLRHIFTNLLTNAVKYSDAGCPVRFELSCNGSEIVSTVCDRGIGIPETDQEWLFSPFHRGGNVGDRPGTGLGLVIIKRCVDLHRGNITVESKLGEGTRVTVKLPKLITN